jgi:hypothetical protein
LPECNFILKGESIMSLVKLDFTNYEATQDMIKLIEKEKRLSAPAAIEFSVNAKIYRRIIDAGWGSIALPIWGHDEPERKWLSLDNPIIEINIEETNLKMIHEVAVKENINIETAVSYFLLFTMKSLGYHI